MTTSHSTSVRESSDTAIAGGFPGLLAADRQSIDWLHTNGHQYQFYFMTVTFKDSSPGDKRQKYTGFFDGNYINRKLLRLIGYSHGDLALFMREYECSLMGSMSNSHCPHHIHAVIGVPSGGNQLRLMRNYKKALAPRRSRIIASVDLNPLVTDDDVTRTYQYMRKGKLRGMPFQ
jgi:hypothetical protein